MRYGGAVLAVVLATALRLVLDPLLGELFPFGILFLAILVVAAFAGRGPALLTVGLGAAVAARFLVATRDRFFIEGLPNRSRFVLSVMTGVGIAVMGGALRSAKRRAEQLAEEASRQREQLRITLASIGDAVLVTDTEGRVTLMNPVAEALTGWSASEAVGMPLGSVFRIVDESTGQAIENPAFRPSCENRANGPLNATVLIGRDGIERPVDDSAFPIQDAAGRLMGTVLVVRDMSQRQQADAEIQRAGEQARTILENIHDAFFAIDRDWRFLYINRQAEIYLDRTRQELIGQVFWDAYPDTIGTEIERNLRKAMDEGVSVKFEVYYSQHKRWYENHSNSSPEGLTVYFRDVSERRRAEELHARVVAASEHQRRVYETALSSSLDHNYIFDLEGRFTFANLALLSLWDRDASDVIGSNFYDLEYPRDLAVRLHAQIRQVIETKQPVRDETPYTGHSGERQYDYIFVPVIGATGAVEAVAGTTRDITERNRVEQQLRLFVEHAPAAVAMFDRDMRYLLASRRWLVDFDLGDANLVGRTQDEVMPDIPIGWRESRLRCLAGAVERVEEDLYLRPDGREEWLRWESRPWRDDRGQIGGILVFSEIVTEQVNNRRVVRQHAETLSGILAASVDNIYVMDRQLRYQHISTGGARVMGFEPAQMKGKHWSELGLPADVMVPFQAEYELTFRTGRAEWHESHYLSADGVAIDYEYTIAPIAGADRQPEAIVIVSRDVTRHKVAERERQDLLKELKTKNAFINAVLNQVPAAIVVADAATGRLLMSNHEARRIVRQQDEAGQPFDDESIAFIPEAVHPDGRRYSREDWPLTRALSGETVVGEEIELVPQEGSRVTIRANAGPIRVGDALVAAVIAYHDITDRKAAEQAARFLADASAILSGLVDYESTLERVARLAVPTFADWAIFDIVQPDGSVKRLTVVHSDASKAELAQSLRCRGPHDPEATRGVPNILRTGRSEITVEITDSMIVVSAGDEAELRILRDLAPRSRIGVPLSVRGKMLGVLSFFMAESGRRYAEHDLAVAEDLASRAAIAIENARLYSELKEADRRKNVFLATLAHELRNPLAPIRNVLHLMRQPATDGDVYEADRAMAERQVVHLTRLIDDLMDLARISRGKIELRKSVVDLATIVNQAVETSRTRIEERRHRLTVTLPETPIRLEADPTRLEQVLWNLLNNAAKYTQPGGRIDLVVLLEGREVLIRLSDSGNGIRREMLSTIFEMFIQVGDLNDQTREGLGVGLSLVRTLVEMHGGSILAQSAGLGLGSEFTVKLPILEVAVADTPAGGVVERPARPRAIPDDRPASKRILVVDDNEDAAKSLARLLTRLLGHEVRVAHDGPTALVVGEEFSPEVILLDIGMPGMDGYEVAQAIRARAWGEAVVIIALTGWGQEEDRLRSRQAGFDHHLVKPVDPADLETLLAETSSDSRVTT